MTISVMEDRSIRVGPEQVVKSDWVDIDLCILANRAQMSPEAVEKKYRRLLQQGESACWPPIVGYWDRARFYICDGRHEYVASLLLGRSRVFVAWLVDVPEAP